MFTPTRANTDAPSLAFAALPHPATPGHEEECELCGLARAAHREHSIGYRCYGYYAVAANAAAAVVTPTPAVAGHN